MTRGEIVNAIKSNNSIKLDSFEYVLLKHSHFSAYIRWVHEDHVLTISKTPNSHINQEIKSISLEAKDILILNPKHAGHERLFRIRIDEINQKILLTQIHDMSRYGTHLHVVDSQ